LGQKVNPIGFRLGVIKGWQSRWYAERDYKDIFKEDYQIRQIINKELANASVSHIEIERAAANQVSVTVHTAKPGIVIGKSGEKVDRLRTQLEAKTKKRVRLNIMEIRQPELDAFLVARSIAEQLERRVSFRRAMKMAAQKTMRANAKGIKILAGGRLGGAEIARSEKEVDGKIPLQTLRADIDYGFTEAHTTFGVIGIKVWIYKGDILPSKRREAGEAPQEPSTPAFQPREREGGERRGGGERRRGEGGYRGERGQRPQGDRSQGGERGERGPRQQGERPARPQGERRPRPQGQGDQSRTQGQGGQGGERPPRQPRPQGERGQRPQGARVPRQRQEQAAQPEQAPATPTQTTEPEVMSSIAATTPMPEVTETPTAAPETTTPNIPTPETATPETPTDTETGSTQSE
jgi:small subunit ribosomal protein S3